MNKAAFTLIELLIVITIITLVSVSGVVYLFRYIGGLEVSGELEEVVNIIDELDKKVSTKEVLDYTILIDASIHQKGMTYSTNQLGLDYTQEIQFNSNLKNGSLSTSDSIGGSDYAFKIFSGVKFESEKIIDTSDFFTRQFRDSQSYRISATSSGNLLNDLHIYYYSPTNISDNSENYLELIGITNSNKSTYYNSLEIRNLNGDKSLVGNGSLDLTEAYLHFEKQGIQKFIQIKK